MGGVNLSREILRIQRHHAPSRAAAGGREGSALLTIVEAAAALRIGRSLAYQLAHEYLASDGTAGLPVVRFGTCLRVPAWALLELAVTGRVVRLCDAPRPASVGLAS